MVQIPAMDRPTYGLMRCCSAVLGVTKGLSEPGDTMDCPVCHGSLIVAPTGIDLSSKPLPWKRDIAPPIHEGSPASEQAFCPACMAFTTHTVNTALSVVSHCTVCGLVIDRTALAAAEEECEELVRVKSAQGHYGHVARRDW
jgi:hypothetical protein